MAETYDAIIIGGGVMGASIISNLATIGMTKTVLLEKSTIGAGSTGRSSGAIRMHYSTAVNASLAHESLKVFTNFSDIVGEMQDLLRLDIWFLRHLRRKKDFMKTFPCNRPLEYLLGK